MTPGDDNADVLKFMLRVARHCRVSMALKSSPEPVDLSLLRACVPAIGLLLISRLHFRKLIRA